RDAMRLNSIMSSMLLSPCALSTTLAGGSVSSEEIQLQKNPPERYTVQKGDTLWGIAARFLQQRWRWPEVWRMNREQIRNPHWIYPGDVIVLDRIDGQPRLSVDRQTVRLLPSVRVDTLEGEAIASIPPGDISP